MMKRIFFIAILTLSICSGWVTLTQAATTPQDVVNIYYSGTVVIPPCTIATPTITVDFGNILAGDLATADSATEWKNTVVSLTDCSEVSHYSFTVSATQSTAISRYIANSGTAEHVAVEALATLLGDEPITNGTIISGNLNEQANMNMILRFRIHNDGTGPATTGSVVSTITLTYTFN